MTSVLDRDSTSAARGTLAGIFVKGYLVRTPHLWTISIAHDLDGSKVGSHIMQRLLPFGILTAFASSLSTLTPFRLPYASVSKSLRVVPLPNK